MKDIMKNLRNVLFFLITANTKQTYAGSSSAKPIKVVIGVDGGTESIRACCFNAENGHVIGESCAIPYSTTHPNPGWAEQDPQTWYENLVKAVRGAVKSIPKKLTRNKNSLQFCSLCVDTTCCSVVALDENYNPLRPCLLWMDARSSKQAQQIFDTCRGDPALDVNCGGEGPISAEWLLPKALWIRQNEPELWENAKYICEYQDYINYKLTDEMCASSCNAAVRWHWNGQEALLDSIESNKTNLNTTENEKNNENAQDYENTEKNKYPGRPMSLYEKLGIPELAEKLPKRCISMSSIVGKLSSRAAKELSLPEGLPVAQGGPDAFVGMVGLGCIYPGQLCLITGSSHLHCVVSSEAITSPGTWGAYKGAPIEGVNFAEGGQSSTGSILKWSKDKLFGLGNSKSVTYRSLDDEAAKIPPGSDGLIALETFQGSRTPVTDPLARGALIGLTLAHTKAHVWRAFIEAVCFGTRACVEGLVNAGHPCHSIIMAGGATRSQFWLQLHADITGIPVIVCENSDAPLLGCAILASVAAGVHDSIQLAVASMVREKMKIHPQSEVHNTYNEIYNSVYKRVPPSLRSIFHSLADIRGGEILTKDNNNNSPAIVSPSLLACDWSDIRGEIKKCLSANASRLHVDVFDGVFINSPDALTFGPQMVKAIRDFNSEVVMDVHLCVQGPIRYVDAIATSGANSMIFQWEAMHDTYVKQKERAAFALENALTLTDKIKKSGLLCGISINPATAVDEITPLLESGNVDLVDVLAVEAGFGGQTFQNSALLKLRQLHKIRQELSLSYLIMVDGGINPETAPKAYLAGADILVAGSAIFKNIRGFDHGISNIRNSITQRLNT